ncbi:MAG: undecaprenyl-diphosphate phosphatase [Eubacteriales bacterium]|nr:undecaprenyl-diphosphate phosphatase [Eubacteriales bacterium]
MDKLWEIVKLFIYGLVEGITEWLPVSSTGHLLLLEEHLPLNFSDKFLAFFRIVIQLAAILAVIIYFWQEIWPVKSLAGLSGGYQGNLIKEENPVLLRLGSYYLDRATIFLWLKIILACLPAAIVGLLWDDVFEAKFYNPFSVSLALIIVGVCFILIESLQGQATPRYQSVADITWQMALFIGLFQMLAGVFPGVSRSGACILAGLILGLARPAAAAFSFYLAIPVMLGASFLKLLRLDLAPGSYELLGLALASLVAFIVSMLTIRFFLGFVRSHSFLPFAIYRIILGFVVLISG